MSEKTMTFQEKISKTPLTKKNRLICDYILNHYSNVIRMTVSDLSGELGISDITVIRLAKTLGYSGFREMQKDLQRMAENGYGVNPSGPLPMNVVSEANSADNLFINSTYQHTMQNIQGALEMNSPETLRQAAEVLFRAKKIFIAGFWKCIPLVKELELKLRYVCDQVTPICSYEPNEFFKMLGAGEEDCLVLFGFHRFPKGILRLLKIAVEQKMKLIILTEDAQAWSAYHEATVLMSPRDGDYYSNMLGASFIVETLAAKVTDLYMKSDRALPNGKKRNKVIGETVLDMDYFAEWPNVFFSEEDMNED